MTTLPKHIKLNRRVAYKSRIHAGLATITDIETRATGVWITLRDDTRNAFVKVRPSQVSPK